MHINNDYNETVLGNNNKIVTELQITHIMMIKQQLSMQMYQKQLQLAAYLCR